MQCTVQPYDSCLHKKFSVKTANLKSCRQIAKESNPRPKKSVHFILVLTKILLRDGGQKVVNISNGNLVNAVVFFSSSQRI